MSRRSLLMGLDVGTTHIKGILYDPATGDVVSQCRELTPGYSPRPGWTECDPIKLWRRVRACISVLVSSLSEGNRIEAVAAATMGESGTLYDKEGNPLYPIIAWFDPRTQPQEKWWLANYDAFKLFQITGHRVKFTYGVNKIMWLREHLPDMYAQADRWLGVHDMVVWKLSGVSATDHSIASRAMLLDQQLGDWSDELLQIANLPRELLPRVHPSGQVVGRVTREAAAETGLPSGTPLVTGGHDHLCAALACGCTSSDSFLDSAGTAEAILWITDRFDPLVELYTLGYAHYRHVVPGTFVIQGGLDSGGAFLDWTAKLLGFETEADRVSKLLALAAASPPGARGVRARPFLLGQGTPARGAEATAAFENLRLYHTQADIARAAVEALATFVADNLAALEPLRGRRPAAIIGTGGANRSPLVCQIKADTTGLPFHVPQIEEGAALGASLLAGMGVGLFDSAEAAQASISATETIYQPEKARG